MQGKVVGEFEKKFSDYTGAEYSVCVSSGTAALHLAMLAAGIGKGDEVICPSLSFVASANAVSITGAKPVFADVGRNDLNISVEDAAKRITKKTKAILLVHQIGYPGNISSFKRLCSENNLILIEDAACALGSEYKGKKIGSHSELVCFSFHPRKVITTGEGGMITTSNKKYYNRLIALRQHGKYMEIVGNEESKYLEPGYNYRMTDIAAALGLIQLAELERNLAKRKSIAAVYNKAFSTGNIFEFPRQQKNSIINYQSYCLILKGDAGKKRDSLLKYLNENGIGAGIGITAIHRMPAHKTTFKLPNTEDISDRSLLLPLYPTMKKEEINYIIKLIFKFTGQEQ